MEDSNLVVIDTPTNRLLSFLAEISQELNMFSKYNFSFN